MFNKFKPLTLAKEYGMCNDALMGLNDEIKCMLKEIESRIE